MKITLGKKWRDHKKGTTLAVLGYGLAVQPGGAVHDVAGKPYRGAVVDQQQAEQLRDGGFLEDVKDKKGGKR